MAMLSRLLKDNSPELFSLLLPPLYAQEAKPDGICFFRFVLRSLNFAWYAMEFDGEDSFFGYANLNDPDCAELGYFSLRELGADTYVALKELGLEAKYGAVEIDFDFRPAFLSSVKAFELAGSAYRHATTREQLECFTNNKEASDG